MRFYYMVPPDESASASTAASKAEFLTTNLIPLLNLPHLPPPALPEPKFTVISHPAEALDGFYQVSACTTDPATPSIIAFHPSYFSGKLPELGRIVSFFYSNFPLMGLLLVPVIPSAYPPDCLSRIAELTRCGTTAFLLEEAICGAVADDKSRESAEAQAQAAAALASFDELVKLYRDRLAVAQQRLESVRMWCDMPNKATATSANPCICGSPLTSILIQQLVTRRSGTEIIQSYFRSRSVSPGIPALLGISSARCRELRAILPRFDFDAHSVTTNELIYVAFCIFKHSFTLRQYDTSISEFIISDADLYAFVSAVRDVYHTSNPFHNFRHAVDVLQMCFHFLLTLKCLPPYTGDAAEDAGHTGDDMRGRDSGDVSVNNGTGTGSGTERTGDASTLHFDILTPHDCLSLLVAAIGHDSGHPGLTNVFLNKHKTTLARVYNGKSTLESYHTSVFSRLLESYWPSTLTQHSSVVDSILATDMAVHFEYVGKLDRLIESSDKLRESLANEELSGDEKTKIRHLLLGILIKCADISNVSRPLAVSIPWGFDLVREMNDIAELEISLGGQAVLIGPGQENLKNGQLFFINTFAKSLFKAVSELIPELAYAYEQLEANVAYWESI